MLRLRGLGGGAVMQQIGRLFLEGTSIGLSEGELLDRFVRARDESAFEILVARHGPMVLGVCRGLLRDPNDVDDAFQATFLVLVRKASTLRQCDLLANWLYGVAIRVAMRARAQAARQMGRFGSQGLIEKLVAAEEVGRSDLNPAAPVNAEPAPWLHHEVSHLPEKYRTPVVLCYFEGLTHDEAASRMGCPLGTVKGRLSRARELLRRRLTRRGLTLSAAAIASQLAAPHAEAAVPAALEMSTARAALSLVSSATAPLAWVSPVPFHVTALAEGVLHTMAWNQVRITAGAFLLAGTIATGAVIGATQLGGSSGSGGTTESGGQTAKGGGGARAGSAPAKGAGAAKRAESPPTNVQSQSAAANRAFDQMLANLKPPIDNSIEKLSKWSSLVLEAELVVAANEAEEHTSRVAHRDRMKKLHDAVQARPRANNANWEEDLAIARTKLDEAENTLANAPSSGPGMMQPMMSQMMRQQQNRGGMRGMGGVRTGMMGGGMMASRPGGRRLAMGPGAGRGMGAPGSSGGASEHGVDAGTSAPASPGGMGGQADVGGQAGMMAGAAAGGGMGGQAGGGDHAGMAPGPAVGAMGGGMRAMAGGGIGGGMGAMAGGMGGGMMTPMGGAGGMAMGGMGGGGMAMGGMGTGGSAGGRVGVLSLGIVSAATEFSIRDKNPKSKLIHKKLDEPISMSFNAETPLEDVLKYIKQATTTETYSGIQVYLDPQGLQEVEKTTNSTVQGLELEGVPLKTTLRLLLKQLGLAYCVRDGLLFISSPRIVFEELREAQQELDTAKELEDESTEDASSEKRSSK